MNIRRIGIVGILNIVWAVCSLVLLAQDTSKTATKAGPASRQVQVERGEVVYVSGNDVVIKMEDGAVKHVTVPEGARGTVDGREIGVHDLKPGMKLQRTITTTTIPQTVSTIRTIQGKVFSVNPPSSIILTLPDGTNKQYKVPKDQKFMIGGEEKTVFEVRKGMNLSATVVTQVPTTVAAQQRKVTGSAPPVVEIPPKMEPTMLVEAAPAPKPAPAAEPAPAATEPRPAKLPKTGSPMPLVGLLGLIFCGLSFGMGLIRRSR
jgi:LPXTG-motif cell wall-anchored protein